MARSTPWLIHFFQRHGDDSMLDDRQLHTL